LITWWGERDRVRGDGVQEPARSHGGGGRARTHEHQDTQQEITDVVGAPQQDAVSRAEPPYVNGIA